MKTDKVKINLKPGRKKKPASFEESDEYRYLIEITHKQHPSITFEQIDKAITRCKKKIDYPRGKIEFINCFKKELGIDSDLVNLGYKSTMQTQQAKKTKSWSIILNS